MKKAIINGVIVTPEGEMKNKALYFDKSIIAIDDVGKHQAEEIIDAKGKYVIPGLVDVHVHGYLGEDVSDGDKQGLRKMAKGILANGVTSFVPTTMTVPWEEIEASFELVRALKDESKEEDFDGAEILGVHSEGPFINPKKKGAQKDSNILAPDADKVLPFKDIISIITLAPEMPGGIDSIRKIVQNSDIKVSIGHTDASYEQAMEAIEAGADNITHLFNAMTGLNHRAPGVVGAALTSDAYCQVIADGFHIHPALFSLVYRLKKDKFVLITDCTRAGGLEDGEYTLGGQPIFVKGVECRLADGTIAGSVLKLNKAVYNLRKHTNIPFFEVINAASINAAKSIGVDKFKGSLEVGKDADIVIMDENCEVYNTFVRGAQKYTKGDSK
ncbi:MAG: N-acetylglucosamine-6-phosphate deacetylase [Eubacteriales bacterium]|nr:N-acetylglucosamine-6-phosphate deacetylase [Eubacteriales bacterium]